MKKLITFSLILILILVAAGLKTAYAANLFADTGIRLDSNHVVVVNDFRVPDLPPWWSVGEHREGSKLGFKVSDGEMVLVVGESGKNPLPPWNGYADIKAVLAENTVLGWLGITELASESVDPGKTYTIKAWLSNGELKIAVCTSLHCDFLASYEVSNSFIEVWAEGCTPHLEDAWSKPSQQNPIPMTFSDVLKYVLLGVGALALIMIAVPLIRRR